MSLGGRNKRKIREDGESIGVSGTSGSITRVRCCRPKIHDKAMPLAAGARSLGRQRRRQSPQTQSEQSFPRDRSLLLTSVSIRRAISTDINTWAERYVPLARFSQRLRLRIVIAFNVVQIARRRRISAAFTDRRPTRLLGAQ